MRNAIRLFDRLLRRILGVFEFCADPACLFRVRVAPVPHAIPLAGGTIPAGVPMLELHLWNEHVPQMPPEGPDLAWAVQMRRMLVATLRALAGQIPTDPRLAGVQVVGGVSVLVSRGGAGAAKLVTGLGFSVYPYHNPLGRFGEFWENFYTWGLMWAFNEVSLRHRPLLQLHRAEAWMPIAEFLRRFGQKALLPLPSGVRGDLILVKDQFIISSKGEK
jgi:hypothetical protein